MTELLNMLKQTTASRNGKSNGFLNSTTTVSSSLAISMTQQAVDVADDKKENTIVDEEEIVLPEYEKVKVVGRGAFSISQSNYGQG